MNKLLFPVIYYRMPHEKEVRFIRSESLPLEIDSLKNIPDRPGFILVPFSSDSSVKSYFIDADKVMNILPEDIYTAMPEYEPDWGIGNISTSNNSSKTKEEYCKTVTDAVSAVHSGMLEKVVLSRVKTIKNNSSHNLLKIFYKLCIKYPAAFVSLVYIPGEVMWITATPELLVSAENNEIKTVSLAGTKPVDSIEAWGQKEKDEQQLVTKYINDILEKYCGNITISGPDEIVVGNIKHLKTSFSASLNIGFWSFVSELHPTPAVCGIPLNTAKQFIAQVEGYDRKYYTGFLGPCNMNGRTDLFVNLRCTELFSDAVNLYIGGGITNDSIPEKEWEETELKSETLLFSFAENEKE